MSLERLDHIVAGALFDFGGYLTTIGERITMEEAITAFLDLRGVDRDCEPFLQWQARCDMAGDTKVPTRVEEALSILKSALRDDPSYEWTWHSSIAMAVRDAGATHAVSNAAATRFMQCLLGVDMAKPTSRTTEQHLSERGD